MSADGIDALHHSELHTLRSCTPCMHAWTHTCLHAELHTCLHAELHTQPACTPALHTVQPGGHDHLLAHIHPTPHRHHRVLLPRQGAAIRTIMGIAPWYDYYLMFSGWSTQLLSQACWRASSSTCAMTSTLAGWPTCGSACGTFSPSLTWCMSSTCATRWKCRHGRAPTTR